MLSTELTNEDAQGITSYTAFKKAKFTSKYLFKIIFPVLMAEVFSLTMGILCVKKQLLNDLVSLLSGSCFHTSVWENSYGFAGSQYYKGRTYIKIGLIS